MTHFEPSLAKVMASCDVCLATSGGPYEPATLRHVKFFDNSGATVHRYDLVPFGVGPARCRQEHVIGCHST